MIEGNFNSSDVIFKLFCLFQNGICFTLRYAVLY